MGQGDSARDFDPSESMENAGILDVFPIFHTARLGQKIRRSPQLPLCGVALESFRESSALLSWESPSFKVEPINFGPEKLGDCHTSDVGLLYRNDGEVGFAMTWSSVPRILS